MDFPSQRLLIRMQSMGQNTNRKRPASRTASSSLSAPYPAMPKRTSFDALLPYMSPCMFLCLSAFMSPWVLSNLFICCLISHQRLKMLQDFRTLFTEQGQILLHQHAGVIPQVQSISASIRRLSSLLNSHSMKYLAASPFSAFLNAATPSGTHGIPSSG